MEYYYWKLVRIIFYTNFVDFSIPFPKYKVLIFCEQALKKAFGEDNPIDNPYYIYYNKIDAR